MVTLYISFNKRYRLANEGLVSLTGIQSANSGPPAACAKMLALNFASGLLGNCLRLPDDCIGE